MFQKIKIKNISRFKEIELKDLRQNIIIFGNNGSGKTTFSNIFYYLRNEKYIEFFPLIKHNEKENCYILMEGNKQFKILINSADSQNLFIPENITDNFIVFNRDFVNENIYIGKEIRQENQIGLYEFIVGKEQVGLKQEIENLVKEEKELKEEIDKLKKELEEKEIDIRKLTLQKENISDLQNKAKALEENLNNLKYLEDIRKLDILKTTDINQKLEKVIDSVEGILNTSISTISKKANELKRKYFEEVKNIDRNWFEKGLNIIKENNLKFCPLCKKEIKEDDFIDILVKGISSEYEFLLKEISKLKKEINSFSLSELWSIDKINTDLYHKWEKYIKDLPKIYSLSPENLEKLLEDLKTDLIRALDEKLEKISEKLELYKDKYMNSDIFSTIEKYNSSVEEINNRISQYKKEIEEKNKEKEKLEKELQETLYKIKLLENKEIINLYKEKNKELKDKEKERKEKQRELEEKTQEIMNEYLGIINECLKNFNTDFSIENVKPEKVRGKGKRGENKIEYGIKLEHIDKNLDANTAFSYSLSEGDKTTLAFAFFISKFLKNSENCKDWIVVIDDPISSLDFHRIKSTVNYIVKYVMKQVKQCFILTHNELFFEKLYETLKDSKIEENWQFFEIKKIGELSDFNSLDPIKKLEENKNYLKALRILREYYYEKNPSINRTEIVNSIRIALEFYIKKKYYPDFENLNGVGQILYKAKELANNEVTYKKRYRFILDKFDELEDLNKYSSPSHHPFDLQLDDNEIYRKVEKFFEIIES